MAQLAESLQKASGGIRFKSYDNVESMQSFMTLISVSTKWPSEIVITIQTDSIVRAAGLEGWQLLDTFNNK